MSERLRSWVLAGLIAVLVTGAATLLLTRPEPEEDRAYRLERQLRCPTCKTVSIAESPSATAADMRRLVAAQVAEGRSDEQIVSFFVDRYGQWVVMDPPARGTTLPLWLLVALGPIVGGAVLLVQVRRSRTRPVTLRAADRDVLAAALSSYRSSGPGGGDDEP